MKVMLAAVPPFVRAGLILPFARWAEPEASTGVTVSNTFRRIRSLLSSVSHREQVALRSVGSGRFGQSQPIHNDRIRRLLRLR